MTLGAMYNWIQNSGFVAKSNQLPETLEINTDPLFEATLENHPNKEVIQMFRKLIADADAQAIKQEQERTAKARDKAAGNIDPDTLFDYQGRSLSEIMQDVDLQENLEEVFLKLGDSQVEEVWRRLLQQGADEEPYSPPWERDNTTATDIFSLNTEDITEIHRRLGEFLSNFELENTFVCFLQRIR